MWILTNDLVHNAPYTYYDINAAGPTLLKHLTGIDLLDQPKKIRNIKYGKEIARLGLETYLPYILRTYSKIACQYYDGIIYTMDSVVCLKNPSGFLGSIFKLKKVWTSSLLVIGYNCKSYIAWTTDGRIIVKGDELPIGCLCKLYTFMLNSCKENWLLEFKQWFMVARPKEFVTNKSRLILKDHKIAEGVKTPDVFIDMIDREAYWKKLLPYFSSIYEFITSNT